MLCLVLVFCYLFQHLPCAREALCTVQESKLRSFVPRLREIAEAWAGRVKADMCKSIADGMQVCALHAFK